MDMEKPGASSRFMDALQRIPESIRNLSVERVYQAMRRLCEEFVAEMDGENIPKERWENDEFICLPIPPTGGGAVFFRRRKPEMKNDEKKSEGADTELKPGHEEGGND